MHFCSLVVPSAECPKLLDSDAHLVIVVPAKPDERNNISVILLSLDQKKLISEIFQQTVS